MRVCSCVRGSVRARVRLRAGVGVCVCALARLSSVVCAWVCACVCACVCVRVCVPLIIIARFAILLSGSFARRLFWASPRCTSSSAPRR